MKKLWNRTSRRKAKPEDVPPWVPFAEVRGDPTEDVYELTIVFTGLTKEEVDVTANTMHKIARAIGDARRDK